MTELLKHAFEEAAELSSEEQDAVARWLIEELNSERRWSELFASSQDQQAQMGRKALAEHRRGPAT